MFTVIDHTEQSWATRYKKHGRENGAATYSRKIAEHHIPLWKEYTQGLDVTIGTCGKLTHYDGHGDLAVQYLHEYSYSNPLGDIQLIHRNLRDKFQRVIFVSAYKSLVMNATLAGYEVWHLPMAVDTASITPVWSSPGEHRGHHAAAYFGNLVQSKANRFRDLHGAFRAHGWGLTHITGPQMDCWHELTKYDYVVAVGRCALEAGALGRKVMIVGAEFGGIVTSEAERLIQLDTNCNGRVITFDRDLNACLDSWDSAVPFTNDVAHAKRRLKEYLETLSA